jgi:hemolysin D
LAETRAGYAHYVLKDLGEAEQKESKLVQQLAAAAHKAEQTVLTTPIDGAVQQFAAHTVGGVVTPAQALPTLLPDDARLLIEAIVDNKDIGFVHAGQEVAVKVQTFEITRWGLLHGHVVDVSRDRITEPRQGTTHQRPSSMSGSDEETNDQDSYQAGYVAQVALDSAQLVVDDSMQAVTRVWPLGQKSRQDEGK